jgi:hypothetical protein
MSKRGNGRGRGRGRGRGNLISRLKNPTISEIDIVADPIL